MLKNITTETAENELVNQEVSFDVTLYCKQNNSSVELWVVCLRQFLFFFNFIKFLLFILFHQEHPHT